MERKDIGEDHRLLLSEEALNFLKELNDRKNAWFFWGKPSNHISREDVNVKYAWVEKNGNSVMLGVDNKTMQGYKMEEERPMWKIPLEEESYDKFIRWCTSFDL